MLLSDVCFAILPPKTVKDESTFFLLVILLGAFIGAAIYLRIKRRKEEKDAESSNSP